MSLALLVQCCDMRTNLGKQAVPPDISCMKQFTLVQILQTVHHAPSLCHCISISTVTSLSRMPTVSARTVFWYELPS